MSAATEITLADLPDGTIWNATGTPIRVRAGDHEVTIPPAYGMVAHVYTSRSLKGTDPRVCVYGIPAPAPGVCYIVSRQAFKEADGSGRCDLIAPAKNEQTDKADDSSYVAETFLIRQWEKPWSRHANPERK